MGLSNGIRTVARAGLIAGTLDGLAAAILYVIRSGKDPLNVYRFIASGVFGKDALAGGVPMALWGIFFHYTIATGWGLLFFIVYPNVSFLGKSKIVSGIGYGVFVWLMMNLVVVPLSNTPPIPMTVNGAVTGIVILMICVGIPISMVVHTYYAATAD